MDFSLIETMRWERDNGFARLNLHMARLKASAQALGFEGADRAETELNSFSKKELRSGLISHRVRLELFPDAKINITSAPFQLQSEDTIWKVKVASTCLSSEDTLLHHKTSRRSVYDQARAEFSKEEADEVLLLNEKGEVCEGTITSLFVDDGSGILLTPPLNSGLLAGVLRTSLLCAKKARVQKLTPSDLDGMVIYVGNSLRGLIRAKMN